MIQRRVAGRHSWLTSWRILVTVSALVGGAGLVGLRALQSDIQTRAVDSAAFSARLISSLVVSRNITMEDISGDALDRKRHTDMDADVAQLAGRGQLAGIEVWAIGDGHLVYGDLGHPITETTLPPAEAARARRGAFNTLSPTRHAGHVGPTLDVFLPFDANEDGTADAVVEVLLPRATINDQIAWSTRLLNGGAAVAAMFGAFLLWRARLRQRREAHATRHDALTSLGNRALLAERAESIIAKSREGLNALLLLKLDGYKEITDTLGHHAGDELLIAVAGRLQAAVHEGDTVVRLGGDEFGVLLPDLLTRADAESTAQHLHQVLREPTTIGGLSVEIDVNIGMALAPDHGTDIDALLRRADVAMDEARQNGRGVTVYDPTTDTREQHQLTMLGELRHAISAGQLRLHYQPKCRRDGSVEQVEALVRWQHPDRGLLAPFAFMPLAERTSLIKPLTAWVMGEATRQCTAWRAEGHQLSVAVNISPRNLADPELPTLVIDAIAAAGLPAGALELEITETAVTTDPQRAQKTLHRLRALGVAVSIDDFGTGYTSLSQLGELPVNTLKIDRMFVADLLSNPVHEVIVRNVIQLARDLGLTTVAEGVESHDIWTRLNDLGCDEVQGYILTRPLPPDQLIDWLADWHPDQLATTHHQALRATELSSRR